MQYQLDYTVYREHEGVPGVFEKERGTIGFDDAGTAHEFAESPAAMLEWFGAERGEFSMWLDDAELLWQMSYDTTSEVNRIPLSYRMFLESIWEVR